MKPGKFTSGNIETFMVEEMGIRILCSEEIEISRNRQSSPNCIHVDRDNMKNSSDGNEDSRIVSKTKKINTENYPATGNKNRY